MSHTVGFMADNFLSRRQVISVPPHLHTHTHMCTHTYVMVVHIHFWRDIKQKEVFGLHSGFKSGFMDNVGFRNSLCRRLEIKNGE
ncbi:hypothetical protein AMECASPLE_009278 [Ameca splendens]|uniref:Uncharacterized protein n=1 Tax=Ameca splendens TaxID=208324 RepID=A0ABV0XP62_9TELE